MYKSVAEYLEAQLNPQPVSAQQRFTALSSGTLLASALEQVVVEYSGLSLLIGYIDLSAMQLGDTVEVSQYVATIAGGAYVLHAREQYNDVQPLPLLHISPKLSYWAIRVTLRQVAGIFRLFPYTFALES